MEDGFLSSLDAVVQMESQADVYQGREDSGLPPATKPADSAKSSRNSKRGKSKKRHSNKSQNATAKQKVAQGLAWLLAGFGMQIASMVVMPFSEIGLYLAGAAVGFMVFGLWICSFVSEASGARYLLYSAIGIYLVSAFSVAIMISGDNPLAVAGMSLLYYLLFVAGIFICTKALDRMAGYFESSEAEMHAEWILHWGTGMFVLIGFPSRLGGVFGADTAGAAAVLIVLAAPIVWCVILARFIDLVGSLRKTLVPDDRPY